jgi:HEAT repeat protein
MRKRLKQTGNSLERLAGPARHCQFGSCRAASHRSPTLNMRLIAALSAGLAVIPFANAVLAGSPATLVTTESSTQELIAALDSNDPNQWSRATWMLGRRTNEADVIVPALVKAAQRPQLRYSALFYVKNFGPKAEIAIPELIMFLKAPPEAWEAAEALGNIGLAAVPALQQAAAGGDSASTVWASAALVMSDGNNPAWLRYLASVAHQDDLLAVEALRSIEMLGPRAAPIVPELMDAMDKTKMTKRLFVQAFFRIGKAAEPALPRIFAFLETADFYGKREALLAVNSIGGPRLKEALPLLISTAEAALTSSDSHAGTIREESPALFGHMGPDAKPAIPVLLKLEEDKKERVRANAVTALAQIDPLNKEVLPRLLLAMDDASAQVQYAANAALLKTGPASPDIVRAFIRAVRNHAQEFPKDGFYNGPADHIIFTSERFFRLLGPQQRYIEPDLRQLADDPNPGVQRIARAALRNIGADK